MHAKTIVFSPDRLSKALAEPIAALRAESLQNRLSQLNLSPSEQRKLLDALIAKR